MSDSFKIVTDHLEDPQVITISDKTVGELHGSEMLASVDSDRPLSTDISFIGTLPAQLVNPALSIFVNQTNVNEYIEAMLNHRNMVGSTMSGTSIQGNQVQYPFISTKFSNDTSLDVPGRFQMLPFTNAFTSVPSGDQPLFVVPVIRPPPRTHYVVDAPVIKTPTPSYFGPGYQNPGLFFNF